MLAEHGARHSGRRSAGNFDWMMRSAFFPGVELRGMTLLDVGCGHGDMALWAAAQGARVVGLEPEAAGSGSARGAQAVFEQTADRSGLSDRAQLLPLTLDAFAAEAQEPFDVILMAASINHIDEAQVTRLHVDAGARDVYRGHLRTVARLAAPGGTLIVSDVGRRNLFAGLKVKNPLSPTIEWHKHQQPELWAELLGEVGFESPVIRWPTLNTLRRPGELLLANRCAAYLMRSGFVLTMRRL